MDQRHASRLIELDLLERRRFAQAKPVTEHIDAFEKAVKARRNNTAGHARETASQIRRICVGLNVESYHELNQTDVMVWLDERNVTANTRRHYLTAICDFCKWMVRDKRAADDPMENTPKPSPDAEPSFERRPLSVEEFQRLMAYLESFEYYPNQHSRWTAYDRRMIYWTAVSTGYRQNELRSLRRYQLFLDEIPPTIDIKARDAKNRTAASVPIPGELAQALTQYLADLHPASKVFWFPASRRHIPQMLHRDLEGAGITPRWETGEIVDFHSLRTTAICWWLDVYGLPAKRVQILARLKTLALVERYSRKLRLSDDYSWLDRGPRLGQESGDGAAQA